MSESEACPSAPNVQRKCTCPMRQCRTARLPSHCVGSKEKYDSVKKINDESVDVITPVGGTNEEFAEKHFPDANIIKWDDNNTIFDQIVAGDADVMVTDAPETKWVSHTEEQLCAVNPGTPLNFSEQGYAVRLGDEEMLEYVNTWLRIVKNDGTYSTAEKKWYG
jgi:cyclohexadienyl dehydratase